MIKFGYLIHKETDRVIKYEDWKEAAREDSYITIIKDSKLFINPKNIVKAKEMLFNDDFEIIYDPEFTAEDLQKILKDNLDNVLLYKIVKSIDFKIALKNKCGIEV